MNKVMKLNLSVSTWKWLSDGVHPKSSFLGIVKNEEKICATVAGYIRKQRIDNNVFMNVAFLGQLCTDKESRGQGVAQALLLWIRKILPEDWNSPLFIGLIGEQIYHAYYRKTLGYPRVKCKVSEFHYYNIDYLLKLFCDQYNNAKCKLSLNYILKIQQIFHAPVFIKFKNDNAVIVNPSNETNFYCIQGTVWPLFRVITSGKSKNTLFTAIKAGNIKFKHLFSHPIVTYRVFNLFYSMAKTHG